MIFSDEYLDRLAQGWTPAEVRELIRQHKLALQTLDALAVFVPPRAIGDDAETVAGVLLEAEFVADRRTGRTIGKKIMRALALPNSEVHVAIRDFRNAVVDGAPDVPTVGGVPACVTPNGRTDSHGSFVKMVCSFCGGRWPCDNVRQRRQEASQAPDESTP